jgi:hypothetical protein
MAAVDHRLGQQPPRTAAWTHSYDRRLGQPPRTATSDGSRLGQQPRTATRQQDSSRHGQLSNSCHGQPHHAAAASARSSDRRLSYSPRTATLGRSHLGPQPPPSDPTTTGRSLCGSRLPRITATSGSLPPRIAGASDQRCPQIAAIAGCNRLGSAPPSDRCRLGSLPPRMAAAAGCCRVWITAVSDRCRLGSPPLGSPPPRIAATSDDGRLGSPPRIAASDRSCIGPPPPQIAAIALDHS